MLFSIIAPALPVLYTATAFSDNTFFCSESWDKSPLMMSHLQGTSISDWSCGDSTLRTISISFAVGEWFSGGARKASVVQTYGNISEWDVTQVRNMNYLFATGKQYQLSTISTLSFNSDLSKWVTTKCTTMMRMFSMNNGPSVSQFNSKLTNFDTSKVVDMSYMFISAIQFNQDLLNFDTRNVKMFECMVSEEPVFPVYAIDCFLPFFFVVFLFATLTVLFFFFPLFIFRRYSFKAPVSEEPVLGKGSVNLLFCNTDRSSSFCNPHTNHTPTSQIQW